MYAMFLKLCKTLYVVSIKFERGAGLQVISEALLSLSAEEADGTFATVYMPIVVEGHKR